MHLFRSLNAPRARQLVVLLLDGLIALVALWLAMLLRFEGEIAEPYLSRFPTLAQLLVASRLLVSLAYRLHRWSFRFSGLTDGARVGLAGLSGTGLFMMELYLGAIPGPPRSVVVLELLISTALMALVRFSPRLAWMYRADRERLRRGNMTRTLIVGAGAAGEMLLRDLQRSRDHGYQVLGFVDDDEAKWGTIVGGKPIVGGLENLPDTVRRLDVAKVLIAIPRLPAERIREILSLCSDLSLRFKILPLSYLDIESKVTSAMLQDLSPDDLLHREAVTFDHQGEGEPIAERNALVTGGAGSIGSEIATQLLAGGVRRVVLVDFNENGLYLLARRLERRFPEAEIQVHLADVRDSRRMSRIFEAERPQDVFHAAAHKHVPLAEGAPCEAIKNNVLGTLNVARAASQAAAERFVFISTDKAVRPSSVMGATKRLGEMLVRRMARDSETRFCAVRFGNVLDSAGSVVPLFREQIAAGGPVTVTDARVKRYFMTVGEAVGLVLKAAYADYGELCVLEMGEQIEILALARNMITMAGLTPDVDVPIVFTGLRPGEKLAEELLTEEEERTYRIAEKILVAESPSPEAGLLAEVETLLAAANEERTEDALAHLQRIVPSFAPGAPENAVAESEEAATPEPQLAEPVAQLSSA